MILRLLSKYNNLLICKFDRLNNGPTKLDVNLDYIFYRALIIKPVCIKKWIFKQIDLKPFGSEATKLQQNN